MRIATFIIAAVMATCGLGPAHSQSITPAQRMASLSDVKAHINTLSGQSVGADAQSVLAFLRRSPTVWKNPTVIDGSVSAQWVDGGTLVINVAPSVYQAPGPEATPKPTATPVPTPRQYPLSGSVRQGTLPLPNVGIEVTQLGKPTGASSTGVDGTWKVPGLVPGTYTITPRASGFTFSPASREATIVNGAVVVPPFDATAATPTATPTTPPLGRYTLSGTVTVPVGHSKEGFTVLALRNNNPDDFLPPVSTNANGIWTMSNIPSGSYSVSAFKVFYDVAPEAHTVTVSNNTNVAPFVAVYHPLPSVRATEEATALATATAAVAVAAPAPQLPASRQARVLDTTPRISQFWSNKLQGVLRQPRFNFHMASPDASLEGLKKVSGDGLFFLNGSYGLAKVGGVVNCFVQTSTPVRLDNVGQPTALGGLRKGSVCALFSIEKSLDARGNVVRKEVFMNYGIGPRFIRDYNWAFSRHSLVWINTGYAQNAPLRQALLDAGASVYGGWTGETNLLARMDASQWLLDRLLGANELRGATPAARPEPIAQRAFPLDELLPEMTRKGLNVSVRAGSSPTRLTFTRNRGAGDFGLLAPSIEQMFVDEAKGRLTLLGSFGSAPVDGGRVSIAGGPTPIVKWEPGSIICVLPSASQPFGSGSVVAIANGRSSNLVKLSKWEGVFLYEWKDAQQLKRTISIRAVLRGDAHLFRTRPGEEPGRAGPTYIGATKDSSTFGSFRAQGLASETQTIANCTGTVSQRWSGSGYLSALSDILLYNGEVKVAARQIVFGLGVRPMVTFNANSSATSCSGSYSHDARVPMSIDPSVAGNVRGLFTFGCDAGWSAPPGGTGWKTKPSEVFLQGLYQYQVQQQMSWPEGLLCTNPPPDRPNKEEGA